MEWKAKWQSKWKWTPQAPLGVILCETVLTCVLLVAILPRRMATEIIAKSHLMAKMVSIRAVLIGSSCKNCSCDVLMVGLTGAFRTGRALEFMLPLCAIPVSLPRFLESSTCLSEILQQFSVPSPRPPQGTFCMLVFLLFGVPRGQIWFTEAGSMTMPLCCFCSCHE